MYFLKGSTNLRVYWWYLRAMTIPLSLAYFITFALYESLNVFSNIWLSNLVDDQNIINDIKIMFLDNMQMNAATPSTVTLLKNNFTSTWIDFSNRRDYYLWWYLGYGVIQAILVSLFSIVYSLMVANASRYIHSKMLGILLILLKSYATSERQR